MNETGHLVSVLMPVYNAANTVDAAVRSILLQTYRNWELIAVDDGSTDESVRRLRAYKDARIHVVTNSYNRGIGERLNEAISVARGSVFARMDADDVSYPTRLADQLETLRLRPEIDLIGTGMLVFSNDGEPIGKRIGDPTRGGRYRSAVSTVPIGHPTFCGRAEWFRANPYASGYLQDQELLIRAGPRSRFHVIPRVLLGYRESRISFAKQFKARAMYFQDAAAFERERGTAWTALLLLSQTAKFAFDSVAIVSGLQHQLLRHRARRITDKEAAEWRWVWSQVSQGHS
jgi:glycosyltransferase involved in cell wall biosynthesis